MELIFDYRFIELICSLYEINIHVVSLFRVIVVWHPSQSHVMAR